MYSEKEQLSREMERHGIQWQQLGTHDEHLSVMNYKKEKRAEEVAELGEIMNKMPVKKAYRTVTSAFCMGIK